MLTSPLEGEVGGASPGGGGGGGGWAAGGGDALAVRVSLTPHPPRPERRGDLPLKGGGQKNAMA
jgi:hypothetical protein